MSKRTMPACVSFLRLTAATCAALAIVACRAEPDTDAIAKRWLDAMNAHRTDWIMELVDEDATYSDPTTTTPLDRPALVEKLTREWRVWKDQVYTATRILQARNATVIEWHVQQTHPSGKHLELDGVTILTIDGKVIRSLRTYYNAVIFLQFLSRTP